MDPVIEEIDVQAYAFPADAPEGDGTIAWEATALVLVQASSAGTTGIGWTYGPAACGALVSDELAHVVIGASALEPTRSSDAMVKAMRNAGRPGIAGCSISAVDVALWDLKARLLGLPLHRLLGVVRDEVPVYGSGGFTTYNERQLRDQLGGWVHQESIPRIKMKIGESWGTRVDRDLERMRQARSAIGDGAELFVDANGGYTIKQAVRLMQDAADLDIRWFEEPVSSNDLAGLAFVRRSIHADVAAGEYGYDLAYFRRMCEAGAVDCLQADASRCGGITEWLRVAAVAAGFGLEISGHCAPHLHAQVAAAVPNLRHIEWFHDHVRIESMIFDGALSATGGALHLGDAPGLGLAFKAADAQPYRIG